MNAVTRSTGFVALVRLPWGDGFIEPGEPVPFEDGRSYSGMLKRRQIAEAPGLGDPGVGPLLEELNPATAPDGWVDLRGLSWHQLSAALDAYGVQVPEHVVDLTAISTERLLELAAAHGHEIGFEATLEETDAPQPAGEQLGTGEPPLPPIELVIPDPLPASRTALLDLAAKLHLAVVGTGSKGYVKEADLAGAITAEKERRAAAAQA